MPAPRVEQLTGWFGRSRAWILPIAAFALAPKCLACVLAYTGLAAALGLGGPEICGASSQPAGPGMMGWLALGFATSAGVLLARRRIPV